MQKNNHISRSEFLRAGFSNFADFLSGSVQSNVKETLKKAVIPLHRPPGALDELEFLSTCTRCDKCIDACPHEALVRAEAKHGAAIGTPMIIPNDRPCHLCEDYPCIKECPEPALSFINTVKMGAAHVITSKCFAFKNQVCDYCHGCCPLKDKAIIMANNKPRINESHCTGCGLCEYYCPAPGSGIKIIPRRKFSGDK
ncbi:MAG: 4Fe-4S dicluster domain-containing protein [bacterium]|nr:4Fe-4S dicluster domain-containing protein [bacterium]